MVRFSNQSLRSGLAVTAFVTLLGTLVPQPALGQGGASAPEALPAPTRLHTAPRDYFLLRLVGDFADVRYAPGSLDRSANLQTRLELASRAFRKWADLELGWQAFVLTREGWNQAGYRVPYGVPVRVGERDLAAPAAGDAGTVELWSGLLDGALPAIDGIPMVGTADEVSTMLLADVVVQILASEILVDTLGIGGDTDWLRGLITHVVSLSLIARIEPGRAAELDGFYRVLGRRNPPSDFSERDYSPDLSLSDWLWFQARFHEGAKLVLNKDKGKDAVKALRKLVKKHGGVSQTVLLRRYEPLRAWLRESFSAVSTRTATRAAVQ